MEKAIPVQARPAVTDHTALERAESAARCSRFCWDTSSCVPESELPESGFCWGSQLFPRPSSAATASSGARGDPRRRYLRFAAQ